MRFAFWSCQDYTHGYYNAHEAMAREDLDFVVCLGDYIYDETYHTVKDGTAVRDDKVGRAQQQSGPGRRQLLARGRDARRLPRQVLALPLGRVAAQGAARFPTVMLWDDHEVQDNYAGGAPDGGLPASHHYSKKRQAAAYKAFFETMPYSPPAGERNRIYRRLQFGRTVDLLIMDQRQYRANQPCDDASGVPACADYDQPRTFLGTRQMNWLKTQLNSSKAAWKVLANEVTIMPTRVLGGAFFGFDSWDGYPQERENLLTHIRDRQIKDVVFVTGDIHTFIAGDVRTAAGAGDPVAVEFVGGSITSAGLGETDLPAGNGVIIKGNDKSPHTDPVAHRGAEGHQPLGRQGRLRPPRLRQGGGHEGRLRLRDGADADHQEEDDGQDPLDRPALPRRPRAAVDQGHRDVDGRALGLRRDRRPGDRHAGARHGADDPQRAARRARRGRGHGRRRGARAGGVDGGGERRPGSAARRLRARLRRGQARRRRVPRAPRRARRSLHALRGRATTRGRGRRAASRACARRPRCARGSSTISATPRSRSSSPPCCRSSRRPTAPPSLTLLAFGLLFCAMTFVWLCAYSVAVARAGDALRRPRDTPSARRRHGRRAGGARRARGGRALDGGRRKRPLAAGRRLALVDPVGVAPEAAVDRRRARQVDGVVAEAAEDGPGEQAVARDDVRPRAAVDGQRRAPRCVKWSAPNPPRMDPV